MKSNFKLLTFFLFLVEEREERERKNKRFFSAESWNLGVKFSGFQKKIAFYNVRREIRNSV